MITLLAESDSRGKYVSIKYHREDDTEYYKAKFTLMWLDEEGGQLTTQHYPDNSGLDLDVGKRVHIIGVDTV